jgi:predicted SnoaL-like aldol condensation-catalyzing enzyme
MTQGHLAESDRGFFATLAALAHAAQVRGRVRRNRGGTPVKLTGFFVHHPTIPMKHLLHSLVIATATAMACGAPLLAQAQVPVQANPNHEQLLANPDARLAANKRLVYDFWREVFEGGHMELADKYMAESYIQHNPNVPTGRAAFVGFFSKVAKPKPIEPRVKAPLVAITAEGDLVILSFVREAADPKDATKKYTTTWFDMFRIEGGKIAEHWDAAPKQ